MTPSEEELQVGQIVQLLKGRDHGKYSVIIGYEGDRYVLVADGDKRKYDRPKKKNRTHVVPLDDISSEIVESIAETGRVTNGKLRFVIQRFIENQMNTEQKGE